VEMFVRFVRWLSGVTVGCWNYDREIMGSLSNC